MDDEAVQDGEELLHLNAEGAVDVARWAAAAYNAKHFDWNLLCGGHEQECVAERWRMVRWLGEMKLLDEPLGYLDSAEDREDCAAVMLTFLWTNIERIAEADGLTPEEVMSR